MTERGFNTEFWVDTFTEGLPQEGKLLYIYLWTSPHCNPAGLYELSLERIAFETGIEKAKLPQLLELLVSKIKWDPATNLIWVKNFIKRQTKSPKFLIAVAKSLSAIHHNGFIKELIQYNLDRYSISIPYPYSITTISLLSIGGNKDLASITKTYEENIGMITPMIAEKLKDIADKYPIDWFEEAAKEACAANVRKFSYIESILERWRVEGFKSQTKEGKRGGTYKQNPKAVLKPHEYTRSETL